MNVLIVEDEPPIAADIEEYISQHLGASLSRINRVFTFREARDFLTRHDIDLLLLDLNLNGRDGFDVLRESASRNFHVIVISAYTDRAIEAYELGILDFVAKPIDAVRLHLALDRFQGRRKIEGQGARYLIVHKSGEHIPVPVSSIGYFKADGYLVEIHRSDGSVELIEKALNKLELILPNHFLRVHRSYIVDINAIRSYCHLGSSNYEITLKTGQTIPLSRNHLFRFISMFKSPEVQR